MSIKPWKILESTHLRRWLRLDKCELPNGKPLDAMVFEFQPWANVLAVTKNREAVLIRQYRHGVQEVLWEIPGGVVEEDEDPLEGVKRELIEETGYTASKIIPVGKFYPNPAIQTNTMYCFLALDAEQVAGQNLDGAEQIEVHLVPLDELIAMTKRGEFLHALQVAAIFLAFTHMDRVR
jgi:8-oxo-dGTP pyrophosphatase MutT (NUDIX family)